MLPGRGRIKMKIQRKLTLGFAGIAVLIGVVGYICVDAGQKTLQRSIAQDSLILAQETLDKIDRTIHARIEQAETYARHLIFEELLLNSNFEFDKLDDPQADISQRDNEWTSAPRDSITPFMRQLINNELAVELREEMELKQFYEDKYGYPVFGEIFVTNKYGANVALTQKTSDYYQADEHWWRQAVRDGLHVGNIGYDESAGLYALDIAVKAYDVAGSFVGVVKAVLNIREVINILKEVELHESHKTTKFTLLTKDLKVIYSTDEHEFLNDLSGEQASVLRIDSANHLTKAVFTTQSDKTNGVKMLVACARSEGYKDFSGLGWILTIERRAKEIFAPVAKLRTRVIVASLVALILAIFLGFLIAKNFSDPIDKLAVAAAQIGTGRLNTRVEVKSNDEIGRLAASFNRMAEDLKKTTTSIDHLNAANQQLSAGQQQLKATNQQLQAKEEQLLSLNYDLGERVKELNCLYEISNLVEQADISLDEVHQGIVDLIPPSWQYPEITCARISIADKEFKTQNFRKTNWSQSSYVTVRSQQIGTIEVCYLEEKPQSDEGPFSSEERKLINAVSERLGRITERKQAKEALRTLNDDLTSTADKLEETNRELRDFVYIASHDLCEPLRKISSFGDLLKDSLQGNLEEDDRENLEFMIDGAERMTQMIEGLLTYSRLNTTPIQLEPVDLNEIVQQLRHLELAAMLEETDGEIEVPQLLPKVTAEPAQARQLMQNLIANGIKYRRQGIPPRIVITAEQLPGDTIRVEVQDNGIGIKDEYQRDIFKMFKRLHSRREYDGAGIGLAVCKKMIEKHNGSIGVESKEGEGSVFWFTLAPAKPDFSGCHCEHLT